MAVVGADASREPGAPEEAGLWRTAREGSAVAREQLFSLHAAFARQVAARYYRDRNRGDLDLQEFRQLAYAGLLESIDRFDPDRGVPFRGYAARRIAGSILDGIARSSEVREQMAFRHRVRAERVRSLADQDLDSLSSSDAMRALAEIATGLAIGFLLDSGMVATEDMADRRPTAYDGLAWKQALRSLQAEVEDLPEKERLIVRQHYMHGLSFEHIAGLLGLSKGRVSQLHKAAMGRLRRRLKAAPDFVLQQ